MSSCEISSSSDHRRRRRKEKTEICSKAPFLQPHFFDWQLVSELNPDLIAETEDVESMSRIVSAFVLCELTNDDFSIVQVPIVFNLLRLLQVSLSFQMNSQTKLESEYESLEAENQALREKGERVRARLTAAHVELRKWKKASRCPVCNAAFESNERVDDHVKRYHGHVFNAWMSIRRNEPDDATRQTQELWQEIVQLRRQLLDQNKTVLPSWRDRHGQYRETEPVIEPNDEPPHEENIEVRERPRLALHVDTVSVKPVIDTEEDLEIPPSIQRRVDRWMNPKTRTKPVTETVEAVSERIVRMMNANPEAVRRQSEVIRKRFADSVREEHEMPEYDPKLRLRVGGEIYHKTEANVKPMFSTTLDDNRFSDAEYSLFEDPEVEQEQDSAAGSSNGKKKKQSTEDVSPYGPIGTLADGVMKAATRKKADSPKLADLVNPMGQLADRRKPEEEMPKVEEEKDAGECSMVSLGPDSGSDVFVDTSKPRILYDRSKLRKKKEPEKIKSSSSNDATEVLRPRIDSDVSGFVTKSDLHPSTLSSPSPNGSSTSKDTPPEVVEQPQPKPKPKPAMMDQNDDREQPKRPKDGPKPKVAPEDWDDDVEEPKRQAEKATERAMTKTKVATRPRPGVADWDDLAEPRPPKEPLKPKPKPKPKPARMDQDEPDQQAEKATAEAMAKTKVATKPRPVDWDDGPQQPEVQPKPKSKPKPKPALIDDDDFDEPEKRAEKATKEAMTKTKAAVRPKPGLADWDDAEEPHQPKPKPQPKAKPTLDDWDLDADGPKKQRAEKATEEAMTRTKVAAKPKPGLMDWDDDVEEQQPKVQSRPKPKEKPALDDWDHDLDGDKKQRAEKATEEAMTKTKASTRPKPGLVDCNDDIEEQQPKVQPRPKPQLKAKPALTDWDADLDGPKKQRAEKATEEAMTKTKVGMRPKPGLVDWDDDIEEQQRKDQPKPKPKPKPKPALDDWDDDSDGPKKQRAEKATEDAMAKTRVAARPKPARRNANPFDDP